MHIDWAAATAFVVQLTVLVGAIAAAAKMIIGALRENTQAVVDNTTDRARIAVTGATAVPHSELRPSIKQTIVPPTQVAQTADAPVDVRVVDVATGDQPPR